jgi:hypothetical protein
MATLSGALLAVWIAACILIAIFLSVLTLSGLVCTFSNSDTGVPRLEAFSGFVFCSIFAGLFYVHVWYLVAKPQETPATRDILLTVPEKVEVHTEFRLDNTVIGKEVL